VGVPETRFAKSGDVHIAYKIIGEGPIDVVFVAGMEYQTVETLELPPLMEEARTFPVRARPLMRLIRFDKRGTGASDRVVGVPSLEERMAMSAGLWTRPARRQLCCLVRLMVGR
jgi:hypothetical protein